MALHSALSTGSRRAALRGSSPRQAAPPPQRCAARSAPRQQATLPSPLRAADRAAAGGFRLRGPPACRAAAAPEAADPQRAADAAPAAVDEETPAAAAVKIPKISELDAFPIIDSQGLVNPLVPDGCHAHMFAVLDANRKLQYIGFSAGLRASLRTVLGRRPDKAHFFKAAHFPSLDQATMVAAREAWFEECGGAPPGNKLAIERDQWQQPVDAGAISARGRKAAADEKARELINAIRQRGCTEPFEPVPEVLEQGRVDFLTVDALTDEQLQAAREAAAKAARESRSCSVLVDGQPKHFTVRYTLRFPTNGGYMFDCILAYDGMESEHRIIVGKDYYEPIGVEPEIAAEASLGLVLQHKVPRTRTAGVMLPTNQFPASYYSLGGMEQWFGADLLAILDDMSGRRLRDPDQQPDYWRFNRIHDYGPMRREDPKSLSDALGLIRPMGA